MSNNGSINQEEYLKQYNPDKYEKLSVTVDVLIFSIIDNKICVRLVKRERPPFENMLSIPGTFVKPTESLDDAVKRVLREKAGFDDIYCEQLFTWGDVNRDPRMRIISVSYISFLSEESLALIKTKQEINAEFYEVDPYIGDIKEKLAFDHNRILESARQRMAAQAENMDIAFEFMPQRFTLPRFQKITEILLGRELYKANFRKKVQDKVVETGEYTSGDAYRPSMLYTRCPDGEK